MHPPDGRRPENERFQTGIQEKMDGPGVSVITLMHRPAWILSTHETLARDTSANGPLKAAEERNGAGKKKLPGNPVELHRSIIDETKSPGGAVLPMEVPAKKSSHSIAPRGRSSTIDLAEDKGIHGICLRTNRNCSCLPFAHCDAVDATLHDNGDTPSPWLTEDSSEPWNVSLHSFCHRGTQAFHGPAR